MGRIRIDYADVVAKSRPHEDVKRVAAAVERLSATWREGRDDFGYDDDTARAAYLWHLVPAHVCDAARLAGTRLDALDRERLDVLCLGAGPGSEVLGLVEAITAAKASGGLEALREVRVQRVDRVGRWERETRALIEAAEPAWRLRCPDLGTAWTLKLDEPLLVADLLRPVPAAVRDAAAEAGLVLAFNLVSELPPRATMDLPAGAREGLVPLLATALGHGAEAWIVDRAGAPHVPPRFAALRDALAETLALDVTGPRTRQSRCGCAFSRRARQLYRHVHLPTTNQEDGPVRNCRTLWMALRAAGA
ncbi:MAG: hypothetical protein R3E85_16590 [Planctomycetota bacterium]